YGYEEQTMPDQFTEGLTFTLGIEEVSHIVQSLRGQVDIIIVVSHLGLPLDVKLASIVKGIDVMLSGHSHDRIRRPIIADKTIVVQARSNAAFLGRLDISLESGDISHYEYRLIDIQEGLQEDPEVKDLVKCAVEPFRGEINQLV